MRLLLIRHAQSKNNKIWDEIAKKYKVQENAAYDSNAEVWSEYNERRSADPCISELGQAQAKACGETLKKYLTKLREEKPQMSIKLRSSPMERTLQTTMAIVENCGEDFFPYFEVDNCIFEQGGCFTDSKLPGLPGRSPEEIKSAYPLATPTWQGLGWYEHYRKIEGAPLEFEKRGEAYKRAQMIVDKLWEVDVASMRQKDMLILVVHADLLDALIKNLMGVSGDDACLVKMRNTAINEFSMDVDSDTGKKHVSVEYLNNFSHLNGLA